MHVCIYNIHMSENEPKSQKKFKLILGIFLCLLMIVMVLNTGYFARSITFPFTYLFGVGAYVLYLAIFIIGLSMIFRFKISFKKSS